MSVEQCIISQHIKGKRTVIGFSLVARLCLSLLLSCLAVALHSPLALLGLGMASFVYLGISRPGWPFLWKAVRVLLWQTTVLLVLHYLRFGPAGLPTGLRISWQLFLAFLPGMVLLQGTSQSQLVQMAGYLLSPRFAFVLGTSLHFVPLLICEIKGLYQAQILRGARIERRDILKPWCWSDWVGCLIVPVTVHALSLAGDIALAARVRDFGVSKHRTCWPGTENASELEIPL